MRRAYLVPVLCALAFTGPTTAATWELTETSHSQAAASNQDWCKDADRWNDRDEVVCEVRTLSESGQSRLEGATANGSLTVQGTSRRDVSVQARVVAHASTLEAARDLANAVTVTLERGLLRADGPRGTGLLRRTSWHVSYRVEVPSAYDLDLESANGSITITGVRGTINAETANGSIKLADLGGTVRARTANGSTHATVSGSRWDGSGLSMITSNGSARLDLPASINAHLKVGSNNGSINVDFPITVQGNIGGRRREIETTLGSGGPTLEVRTSNGSVRVGRR